MTNENNISIINGGTHTDIRGTVTFVNDFDFKGVDRFYTIRAHRAYEARGWRGHQIEQKWFTVVKGTILLAAVKPDDWTHPATDLPVERFVLSETKPSILHVPVGYATGSMALTDDAILIIFSSGNIKDTAKDEFVFPLDTWSVNYE